MPTDDFDLNLLRVLEAVLDERSVTRAAERLHLSQPAVSHALARARASLGDPLLTGRGAAAVLTPRGRHLAVEVPALMRRIRAEVTPHAFDPSSTVRRFVVAAPDFLAGALAAALHRRLAAVAPDSALEVRRLTVDTGPELVDGTVDAAIGATGSWGDPLRSTFLASIAWRPTVCADHRLAGGKASFVDLAAVAHVDVGGHVVNDAVDAAFAARGLTRRVRVVVSTMPALLDVLPGTDLVGFTPDVGALRPGLARVVLPEEAVVTSYELWWGHRADDDAAGAWFRHELVDVAPAVCG